MKTGNSGKKNTPMLNGFLTVVRTTSGVVVSELTIPNTICYLDIRFGITQCLILVP